MAETKRGRVRVVQVLAMELQPRARCLGEIDASGNIKVPCTFAIGPAPDTRRRAKGHAAFHPTHTVRVINESFSDYKAESNGD